MGAGVLEGRRRVKDGRDLHGEDREEVHTC